MYIFINIYVYMYIFSPKKELGTDIFFNMDEPLKKKKNYATDTKAHILYNSIYTKGPE